MEPITFKQALEYEASRLNLLQSIWYRRFTREFIKRSEKRYNIYLTYLKNLK